MIKVELGKIKNFSNIISKDSPSFSGIVSGECLGEIWVDNVENPHLAVVYSTAVEGFTILGELPIGKSYSQFICFLVETLFVQLKDSGWSYFDFSIDSEIVKAAVFEGLGDRDLQSEVEYSFHKKNKMNNIQTLPTGYELIAVDAVFLEKIKRKTIKQGEFLTNRLKISFPSYQEFLDRSVAFVAVWDHEIVAIIIGTGIFENRIAVDIETASEHQQKGIACSLTQVFVNTCIDKGFIVQWDCMSSNIASNKVARKVGMELFRENRIYFREL